MSKKRAEDLNGERNCLHLDCFPKLQYHCTAELLFYLFRLSFFAMLNKHQIHLFGLIQTSQTGRQLYSDSSP